MGSFLGCGTTTVTGGVERGGAGSAIDSFSDTDALVRWRVGSTLKGFGGDNFDEGNCRCRVEKVKEHEAIDLQKLSLSLCCR